MMRTFRHPATILCFSAAVALPLPALAGKQLTLDCTWTDSGRKDYPVPGGRFYIDLDASRFTGGPSGQGDAVAIDVRKYREDCCNLYKLPDYASPKDSFVLLRWSSADSLPPGGIMMVGNGYNLFYDRKRRKIIGTRWQYGASLMGWKIDGRCTATPGIPADAATAIREEQRRDAAKK